MTTVPASADPLRILMWSGPRNLSTALMRSFSSRPDAAVADEPFYAYYLRETGIDHPGRDDVIAANEADWRRVTDRVVAGPVPGGKRVWYQKHMAHHMLPGVDVGRLVAAAGPGLRHAFLIRDPADVISSYTKVHPQMTIAETGLPYQADLFARVRAATGVVPPVVDAKDILTDPRRTLTKLCEAVGIAFDDRMLHWPAGPHPADGSWGPHWYAGVYASTGFEPYAPKNATVRDDLKPMLAEARRLYDDLRGHAL